MIDAIAARTSSLASEKGSSSKVFRGSEIQQCAISPNESARFARIRGASRVRQCHRRSRLPLDLEFAKIMAPSARAPPIAIAAPVGNVRMPVLATSAV